MEFDYIRYLRLAEWDLTFILRGNNPQDRNVRYGSKADISACPRHVCFTPESGHRNRHVYHRRRMQLGSFVTLAAMRRASSFVSSLAADRRSGSSSK